jgi:phage shock protein C
MSSRFLLNKQNGKLMGVASGLSDLTGLDVLAIRLAIVLAVLLTGPVAIILYLAAGFLAANR